MKTEILKLHDLYWFSYLEGDITTMADLLAEEYTQIGSAEREVFFNKNDAVQFLHETIDQVAGKLEMRNRNTSVEVLDETFIVYELCDVYALADEKWLFYNKFRATTLLKKKEQGWKFIHQHSSFSDSGTSEGQNVSIEKIAAENQQLRDAVKQRTMELEQQTTVLEQSNVALKKSLDELRSTQTQLIHAEKMASLGELTAGIAHEIQNPLNFVNNFSEVSKELIEELKRERSKLKGKRDQDLEEEIISDIIQNLEKINHHGNRASSIVKGMLEHSRSGNRDKELTDINTLADEYLRLAYHGLRAKDQTFNAEFRTELDPALPKVKVIGQDIGRVLLNLINNAFYAVSQKYKEEPTNYKPEVVLKTKKNEKSIEITLQDNGGGIPEQIRDKIFQPFFTTKPAGEGTGLGLSLTYDIITKGHGGSLNVDTKEGLGTVFTVRLPIA